LSSTSPRERNRLVDLGVGALVLLVYLVVQLVLLPGPHPFDPATYFKAAVDFPKEHVDLFSLRSGLMGPVYLAVLALGESEAAFYAVPIGSGVVLAAAVYGTMLVLFGERLWAAAAALVTVLNTSYLLNSSSIFPDVLGTATFTAGFFLLVLGGIPDEDREGRWWWLLPLGAGALFGWTCLVREFTPLLLPAVVGAVLLLRYSLRRVLVLAGAVVGVLCLELVYNLIRFEDPLFHIRRLLGRGDAGISARRRALMDEVHSALNDPLDTLIVFPRLLLSWSFGWALLILVAAFVVALMRFRDRRLWMLAIWGFSFWALMAILGLISLPSGSWILNITNVRYWYPVIPPLVMGGVAGLALLAREFAPVRFGSWLAHGSVVAVSALVLVPGTVVYDRCREPDVWRNDPAERWNELRAWLGTPEAEPFRVIQTDRITARLLPAFTHSTFGGAVWRGRIEALNLERRVDDPDARALGLVLVHLDRIRVLYPGLAERLQGPPEGWSPLFVSSDRHMLVLAPDSTASAGTPAWPPDWPPPAEAGSGEDCGVGPYPRP
jgi:hypothetical protein